jgi:hypothetical protein
MTRFEEVARLKGLEKKADCPPWKYQKGKSGWTNDTVEDSKKGIMWWGNIADDDAIHLAVDLRNAAPWLLEAAACFRPGDAALMGEILLLHREFEKDYPDENPGWSDLFARMEEAAAIMEELE